MLIFQETLAINQPYPFDKLAPLTELLFFDIETTGFQADVSSLYLIGCIYYEDDKFHITQWFADNYRSELDLLHAFFHLVDKHKTLVHYNGNGFDIPYLLKKCAQFHLPYNFDQCTSIDLYRALKPYKKLFALPNYKQKTIEEFLHIKRTDPFTGGELIQVYGDYIKAKVGYHDTDSYLNPLLLHNREDLEGMIKLTTIKYYLDVFEMPLTLQWFHLTKQKIEAIFTLPFTLPTPVTFSKGNYKITLKEHQVFLSATCYIGELKYFYPNYKDYYYLPKEDMAIHKSVASFVDKEFRLKATRENCYLRKSGTFIPIYEGMDGFTLFQMNYKEKQLYIEMNEEMTSDLETLGKLLQEIMRQIITVK